MKLSAVVLGTVSARSTWQKPTRLEVSEAIRNAQAFHFKDPNSRERALVTSEMCMNNDPIVDNTENTQGFHCSGTSCVVECNPGYAPDSKTVAHCRQRKSGALSWSADISNVKCHTCADATLTDSNLSENCYVNDKNKRRCEYVCTNGGKVTHPLYGTPRVKSIATCKCDRYSDNCNWYISAQDADLSQLACVGGAVTTEEPETTIEPPAGCDATKQTDCTSIQNKITFMNSWTCRNCHRLRVEYNAKNMGINDFDNKDYLDIQFDREIIWLQHAHPVDSAEHIGGNVWRVGFSDQAMFGDNRVDFTAEVKSVDGAKPSVLSASSCPCSNDNGAPTVKPPVTTAATTLATTQSSTLPTTAATTAGTTNAPTSAVTAPTPPPQCAGKSKDTKCQWVGESVKTLNSWICRNCFRVRAYYNLGKYGIKQFHNEDFMDIWFDGPVTATTFAHPVASFTDMGNNQYRIGFGKTAQWVNRQMDFTLELRQLKDGPLPKIRSVRSCPCSEAGPVTTGTPTTTVSTAATTQATTKATTTKATTTQATTTKATTTQATTTKATTTKATTTAATTNAPDTCDALSIVSPGITWYQDHPTGGNCDLNWDHMQNQNLKSWTKFVALPKGSGKNAYDDHANCGRCIKIKCDCDQAQFPGQNLCSGGETVAMVVDSCPTCHNFNDVDTSTLVWNTISGNEAPSMYTGSYEYVKCPSGFISGTTKLRFKDGSSQWWFGAQPQDFQHQITKMTVNGNAVSLGEIDGYWFVQDSEPTFPATICFENEQGDSGCATLTSGQIQPGTIDLGVSL